MWLIKRVYMDGAGHEEAFYKDLTLDYIGLSQAVGSPVVEGLRSPVRNAKVVTSTYQQLVNGGGKSTYIALLLSIFEPSVSDFTQYLANHRQSEYHYESSCCHDLPAIIVENSDVYYRLCQLNRVQTRWSLVIYGAGNKVSGQAECVSQLLEVEQVKQLLYFGDLDVAGLKIAHQLQCKLLSDYGISLHLDEWLYNELILNGLMTPEGNANNERFDFELQCRWMPQFVLREMKTLLAIHQRLPQEGVASLGLVI